MNSNPIIPVILSGGYGSRLWPLSRQSFPKQYLPLLKGKKFSLLQETQLRINGLNNLEPPIVVCNEEHRFIVAEQMREINQKPQSILLEPFGRNTAPAICLAALKALEKGEDPNLLVLSADHNILDKKMFLDSIEKGLLYSNKGNLVTFGVRPSSPHTGYGYIQTQEESNKDDFPGMKINKFLEKPDYLTAVEFIKDKRYFWNSGIFLFRARAIIDELKKYADDLVRVCEKSLSEKLFDLDFQRLNKEFFKTCKNISIDNAVFEKTSLGFVIPLNAGWSDIGSWDSVWQNDEKNADGNVLIGNIIDNSLKNCLIRSDERLIVGIGLENTLVIDTNDALLIANMDKAQEVKDVVDLVDKLGPEAKSHKTVYRPWGSYTSIAKGLRWQLKRIEVKPNGKLSLQLHNHRSEHWIVVSGIAEVEINGEVKFIEENQSIYIPLGSKHRLTNPGKTPLVLIEVQSGTYLGEDDIIRFEDLYGREKEINS